MTTDPWGADRIGDWIQTYSGVAFFPLDPLPGEVLIEDIAHSLSMLCRYAGHTEEFYSVAEHSIHMSDWLLLAGYTPAIALEALLHDATEAYVVDLPRPIKRMLPDYQAMEATVHRAICSAFNVSPETAQIVHEVDTRILMDERAILLKSPPIAWRTDVTPLGVTIEAWEPDWAERLFLARFNELRRAIGAAA